MEIERVDLLGGLRAALEAPPTERERLYKEFVLQPVRPGLEWLLRTHLTHAPPPADVNPLLHVARLQGMYTPDLAPEPALAAVDALEGAGVWEACEDALRRGRELLRPGAHGYEVDCARLVIRLARPESVHRANRGYIGFGGRDRPRPGVHTVTLHVWPTDYTVPRLPSCAAHEFHHNAYGVYWAQKGGQVTGRLGHGLAHEGLAETFAGELLGHDLTGPWAHALTEEEVEE